MRINFQNSLKNLIFSLCVGVLICVSGNAWSEVSLSALADINRSCFNKFALAPAELTKCKLQKLNDYLGKHQQQTFQSTVTDLSNQNRLADIEEKIVFQFLNYINQYCSPYKLSYYPIENANISDDDILDYIISEGSALCDDDPETFRGGTGGSKFFAFINPSEESLEHDDYFELSGIEFTGINWREAKVNDTRGIEIIIHGTGCDLSGVDGCSQLGYFENGELHHFGKPKQIFK